MPRRCAALVAALLFLGGVVRGADELIPQVQRELRARRFYFGEIDGRASDETVAAIKRFQETRGIDNTGNLDDETRRALGLPVLSANRDEARWLEECTARVLSYWQARQQDDWEGEAGFYARSVDFYDDHQVSREFIREHTAEANRRWPRRKYTLLQRIASLVKDSKNEVQVTVRVRAEVAGETGAPRVRVEDILFRLRRTDADWQIIKLILISG